MTARANRLHLAMNTLLTIVLVSSAFAAKRNTHFEQIDVERINVIERDGSIRMVIANRERTPGPMEHGKPFGYPSGTRVGMIFYNDEATEAGGLVFQGGTSGTHPSASGSLTFDQYNRDQTLALQYVEDGGRRRSGLAISDYPTTVTSAEWHAEYEVIQAMTDSVARREAAAKWRAQGGRGRLFAGRQFDGKSVVTLADGSGRTRLRLRVDSLGAAAIEFLGDSGQVVRTIGPK
jgi:hypothetical protein